RFLRGFLELQKLILQVLEIRGLAQSHRDTDDAYQRKLPSCSADYSHFLPRQLDAGSLLLTQNNSAHASRRRVRMCIETPDQEFGNFRATTNRRPYVARSCRDCIDSCSARS